MRTSPAIWTVRVLVAALMVIVIEFGIDHLYVNDAFVPQMNVPVLMLTVLICAGLIYIMYRLWKSPSSLDRKTTMQGCKVKK